MVSESDLPWNFFPFPIIAQGFEILRSLLYLCNVPDESSATKNGSHLSLAYANSAYAFCLWIDEYGYQMGGKIRKYLEILTHHFRCAIGRVVEVSSRYTGYCVDSPAVGGGKLRVGGARLLSKGNDVTTKVFLSIDAEEDEWEAYEKGSYEVTSLNRIPMLQEILERYGAIPTYFCTYEVARNESSSAVLKEILDRGRCEIGAHCHPWNTPPIFNGIYPRDSMLCNLPNRVVFDKIKALHELIIHRFQVVPQAFRAGRWGVGPSVAKIIKELGYKVDTSVTPYGNWKIYQGPDFSRVGPSAYRFNPDDILCEDLRGSLVEVPVTIGFLQNNFKRCAAVRRLIMNGRLSHVHILGLLDKLRILNIRWLSPELSSAREMICLTKRLLKKKCASLNLTFHTNSLIPGKNIFVRNEEELVFFLRKIETYLEFACKNNFEFLPLSAATEIYARGDNL